MIEVVTFRPSGARIDTAEADGPEAALLAGRVLHDEGLRGRQGERVDVGFFVDGELVRLVQGRP